MLVTSARTSVRVFCTIFPRVCFGMRHGQCPWLRADEADSPTSGRPARNSTLVVTMSVCSSCEMLVVAAAAEMFSGTLWH